MGERQGRKGARVWPAQHPVARARRSARRRPCVGRERVRGRRGGGCWRRAGERFEPLRVTTEDRHVRAQRIAAALARTSPEAAARYLEGVDKRERQSTRRKSSN